MSETENLANFLIRYTNMRKAQNEYFKTKSTIVRKNCKHIERTLDQLAFKLMIEMNISLTDNPPQTTIF